MKKAILLAACGLMIGSAVFAQEDKLVIKPSGRILLDGAMINSSNDEVQEQNGGGGFQVPDVRIGMKASYGKWEAKADIGYSRQSLSLKDVFVQYNFNKENFLRGGYFVHQFGYQSATSSSFKIAMEEPETHSVLGSGGRLLGVMYQHSDDKFLGTFSLYTDNQSMKSSVDKTGYQGNGAMTRLVWRPLTERGNIFQVGVGGSYDHKSDNNKNMEWSSNYPSRVSLVKVLGAKFDDADYAFKVSPEVALAKGPFGVEAQYIFMTVHRKNDVPNYKAWGAYGNLRFLLNSEYTYVKGDAGIATPDPKSWEIVGSYNYTDMNSEGYQGGKLSDWSLTMNYYINKYMIWRVSGHYVHSGASEYTGFGKNDYKVLETRIQIKF